MSDHEYHRAGREARHDVVAHPERPSRYEQALARYLAGAAYAEERGHRRDDRAVPPSAEPVPPGGIQPDTGAEGQRFVLVGVDDSPSGFIAVDHATVEAELRGWSLRLVHVEPLVAGTGAGARARERGTTLLAELAGRARAAAPATRISTQLCFGSPIRTLLDLTVSAGGPERAGLLVLGSTGGGRLAGLPRSVSATVAGRAAVPVMVARVPRAPARRPDLPVVVGVDAAPEDEAATAFAATEARLRGVPLVAMHAADGDLPGALIDASARAGALVVGTGRRRRLPRPGRDRRNRSLIRHAHCPIFLIHPTGPQPELT